MNTESAHRIAAARERKIAKMLPHLDAHLSDAFCRTMGRPVATEVGAQNAADAEMIVTLAKVAPMQIWQDIAAEAEVNEPSPETVRLLIAHLEGRAHSARQLAKTAADPFAGLPS